MPRVELHPAHVWDCPECGRENFCRSVVAELSEQERAELLAAGEPADGYWMTAPKAVECSHCGTEFETEGLDDDDAS